MKNIYKILIISMLIMLQYNCSCITEINKNELQNKLYGTWDELSDWDIGFTSLSFHSNNSIYFTEVGSDAMPYVSNKKGTYTISNNIIVNILNYGIYEYKMYLSNNNLLLRSIKQKYIREYYKNNKENIK